MPPTYQSLWAKAMKVPTMKPQAHSPEKATTASARRLLFSSSSARPSPSP